MYGIRAHGGLHDNREKERKKSGLLLELDGLRTRINFYNK